MDNDTYVCTQCKNPVRMESKPKRSFMGFARIPCPSCKTEFRYPLTTGYVVVYWLLLFGNAVLVVYLLSRGQGIIPNPIGILVLVYVVISLVKNSTLKRNIAKMSMNSVDVPPLQVNVVECENKDHQADAVDSR